MGLAAVRPKGILRYNQYDQAIRAALEGQGIALGRIALIEPLLSEGRLVAVGDAGGDHAHGYAYWLVQPDATPREDVKVVVDWIKTEARSVEMRLEDELNILGEVESQPR
jgi:LysR family transcriptional regulator, glycine cleavage system transcriptional activator